MEFIARYANTYTDIHTPERKGGGGGEDKIEETEDVRACKRGQRKMGRTEREGERASAIQERDM